MGVFVAEGVNSRDRGNLGDKLWKCQVATGCHAGLPRRRNPVLHCDVGIGPGSMESEEQPRRFAGWAHRGYTGYARVLVPGRRLGDDRGKQRSVPMLPRSDRGPIYRAIRSLTRLSGEEKTRLMVLSHACDHRGWLSGTRGWDRFLLGRLLWCLAGCLLRPGLHRKRESNTEEPWRGPLHYRSPARGSGSRQHSLGYIRQFHGRVE
mmetsp:Transcript_3662/g.6997  ORF Transcript_3662/g.6997 Transcript_3662/m.6997 type:complete len:206 (+) Transcript_3662:391-1008(+)